jgi:sigma-B regulation protein RsbU (phosphoserine phosphatase)
MSGLIGLRMPDNLFATALAVSQQQVTRLGLEGFDDALVKEDLQAQMAAARDIQQRILPHEVPEVCGFVLAAANHPSKAVSGDTYDFISLKDGAQGLVIADVSGKGLPAALLASTLQASLRALALVCDDPGELLAAANRALFASTDPERFATLFIAVLAADGSSLRYASAGHNPPLLRRADGRCEWLQPDGTPLGMMPEMIYPVTDVSLAAGDLLVSYTDGITEAVDDRDVEFDEAGLRKVVERVADEAPAQIICEVIAAVHRHVAGTAVETSSPGAESGSAAASAADGLDAGDDLTLVVLKKI